MQRYERPRTCIQWLYENKLAKKELEMNKEVAAAYLSLYGYRTVNAGTGKREERIERNKSW